MEQISINITKYKQHNDEVYQVWKDVWNEYSKEFVDATVQNSTGLINNKMMASTMLL